jgi:threonine/homoserine/homoserine lactone efflux protein
LNNPIPFLLYVVATLFTPGPNTILSMVNARQYGFKNSFPFYMGVFSGFITVMIGCSYFNLFLFNFMPKIEKLVSIFGTIYMLFLAYMIAFGRKKLRDVNNKKTNTYLAGLTMQFLNPKVLIFGMTVMGTFVIPNYKSGFILILFSLFTALIGLTANLSWGLFGAMLQNFLAKYDKQFNIIMGLLLVYCAISISGFI